MGFWDNKVANESLIVPAGKGFWDAPLSTSKTAGFSSVDTTKKVTPFTGGGYGAASETDPYTGKPLAKVPQVIPKTYLNPQTTISVVDKSRVASTFDPTKAQPITRNMLVNGRLPESASQAMRKQLGAGYNQELDHQIALTLSGANTPENLKLIPTSKNQKAGIIEGKLANDVIGGKISLLDAQLQDAKMKGIKLPESKPNLITKIQNELMKSKTVMTSPTFNKMASLQQDPLSLNQGGKPTDLIPEYLKTINEATDDVLKRVGDFINTYKAPQKQGFLSKVAGRLGALGSLATSWVGAALSPVTALFTVGEKIPVLGSVTKLVNIGFGAVGELSSKAVLDLPLGIPSITKDPITLRKVIDKLPISTDSRDKLVGGIESVASLAGMILAGSVVAKTFPKSSIIDKATEELKSEGSSLTVIDNVNKIDPAEVDKLSKIHSSEDVKTIVKQAARVAEDKQTSIAPEIPKSNQGAQAGFINPAGIVEGMKENISNVKDYISESQKQIKTGEDISDNFYKLKNAVKVDNINTKNILKSSDLTPEDQLAIYNWMENPKESIIPEQVTKYNETIKPLVEGSNKIYNELKNRDVPLSVEDSPEHVTRVVKGRGSFIDKLVKGFKGTGQGGLLSKTAGFFKKRTMMALEDETGNRTVISIKDGIITAWDKNNPIDMGKINMKRYDDLMNNKIDPLRNKIGDLQKEIETLQSVKTREPISIAKLQALEERARTIAADMNDTANTYEVDFGKNDQQAIRDAQSLKILGRDIKMLSSVKSAEDVVLTKQRIKTLNQKIIEAVNTTADIENQFNNGLSGKVFVDKNGKAWNVVDATTKEIEANTGVRYYKTPLVNELQRYNKLNQMKRATDFIDSTKDTLNSGGLIKKIGDYNVPDDWRGTDLPQMRGYVMPKKLANIFDSFYQGMKKGSPGAFTKISLFLRTAIFFNPLIHTPNIILHWTVARGWDWANPVGYYRMIKTGVQAFQDVWNMNDNYIKWLDEGGPGLYSETRNADLYKLWIQKGSVELSNNPSFLAQTAEQFKVPADLIKKAINLPYKLSGAVTWFSNDFFTYAKTLEDMAKGKTMTEAIGDVGKHMPDYRMPAELLGSKQLMDVIKNPNITMFSAYHYGALKSYFEMAKSFIVGKEGEAFWSKASNAERIDALGKMVTLGVVLTVIYPEMDKVIKMVTGNKNATLRRAGATTFPYNLSKFIQGKESFTTFLTSILTPAVIPGAIIAGSQGFVSLPTSTEFQANPLKATGEAANVIADKLISPYGYASNIISGKKSAIDTLLQFAGISTPKSTPSQTKADSLIYDQKPKILKSAKDMVTKGEVASAYRLISTYNQDLFDSLIGVFVDQGMPQDQAKKQVLDLTNNSASKLRSYFITGLTQQQMQNYEKSKSRTSLQKLILK